MTNYAFIVDGFVQEVTKNPARSLTPDELFVEVPDGVAFGWTQDEEGAWRAPDGTSLSNVGSGYRAIVSRVEFKQLFAIAEQVQIKMARDYSGDEQDKVILKYTLDAAYDMLDDPQLEKINLKSATISQFLNALSDAAIITPDRVVQIQQGVAL